MTISTIAAAFFVIVTAIEICLFFVPRLWRYRKAIAMVLIPLVGFFGGYVMTGAGGFWPGVLPVIFCAAALYKAVNLLRIIKDRMHERYLHRTVLRSSLWLSAIQTAVLLMIVSQTYLSGYSLLVVFQVLAALGLAAATFISFRKYRYRPTEPATQESELPTVTVAIPARNETEELVGCLQSALASDYPKLEIIVLDDCSHKKTSDIIKKFAHSGIRFISGKPPHKNWLAKNQAYQSLLEHASGKLILYCGVDVRFEPDSINKLVDFLNSKDLSMLSVLPDRPAGSTKLPFVQPLRYWRELAVPRFLMRQPASLSTCWMIERSKLKSLGGFSAVSRNVRPETFFARECHRQRQYRFVISQGLLGVQSVKPPAAQYQTALRVRYPELHKRPESVFLLSLVELGLLLLPFIQVAVGLYTGNSWLLAASLVSLLCLYAVHFRIAKADNGIKVIKTILNLPVLILSELYLINKSMLQYEFQEVEWKGRNICLPVMHVTPKLPETD